MVNLSNIKKGDFVRFKNGEVARVNEFSKYENKINIYFDRRVFGKRDSCFNWNYFENGVWVRPDISTPCNDIVKILENNNESV